MPRRPQRQTAQAANIPAPIGGLNTVDAGAAMPENDALVLYNMIAAELGLRTRLGYREYCTGLTGAADNTVRTVMPFAGSHLNGSTDKLFAATSSGIWDVSASSSAPVKVLAFPTTTGDAGYGASCATTTPAGKFLLYCDEVNGYFVYTESTNTWAQVTLGGGAGQVSGVDPATFVFCTVWKNRVWFVTRDSTVACYLPFNSVYGAANTWDFGPRFRAGGPLAGLYNWTVDGGSGIENSLVAISTGGDVVIYQGTDPASVNTFAERGSWYVGGIPYGRRIATDYGGDLLILSSTGILPLTKLVVGNTIFDRSQYATAKIANLFNRLASTYKTLHGWSLRLHPEDNTLLVTVPVAEGQATNQLAMSLATRGWSQYRNLPILSSEAWNGKLYFGTADGRICINTDYLDNVLLSNPNSYSPIQWSLLTAFRNLGNGRQKRVSLIRPTILSEGSPSKYTAAARYRYDLSEAAQPAAGGAAAANTWDNANWDSGTWTGSYAAGQLATGGAGIGPEVAIAMAGTALARTSLVGIDVLFDQGGFL